MRPARAIRLVSGIFIEVPEGDPVNLIIVTQTRKMRLRYRSSIRPARRSSPVEMHARLSLKWRGFQNSFLSAGSGVCLHPKETLLDHPTKEMT